MKNELLKNKPGRLTDEEFVIMKTHAEIGAQMLESMAGHQDNPIVKTAYQICRWHHERYDGRGYPDGLKGDAIPVAAQVVALADVYDALTSSRVYKGPYTKETAIHMILDGQCGNFNPVLLECLREDGMNIDKEQEKIQESAQRQEIREYVEVVMRNKGASMSGRALRLLDYERMKYNFFASMTEEIQFEYIDSPPVLTVSKWGAKKMGVKEVIQNPIGDKRLKEVIPPETWNHIADWLRHTMPENPEVSGEVTFHVGGEERWFQVIFHAVWSAGEPPVYEGAFGRAIDIHDRRLELEDLKKQASRDSLTGLLNHLNARRRIQEKLDAHPFARFVLIIFDLDYFKTVNDTYGHRFGDKVLKHVAERLDASIRGDDVSARIGGDAFVLFMEWGDAVVAALWLRCIGGGKFVLFMEWGDVVAIPRLRCIDCDVSENEMFFMILEIEGEEKYNPADREEMFMTLTECYEKIGGDYQDVISRLRSERLVQKFVLKFLDDSSYQTLCSSMAEENWEEAFRAAHTIKGICQNLSFTALMASGSALTEALREGNAAEAVRLKDQVDADYKMTADGIREFQNSLA